MGTGWGEREERENGVPGEMGRAINLLHFADALCGVRSVGGMGRG